MAERSIAFAGFLESTRIYAVTDDSLSPERLVEVVDALLGVGIRIFQYREKSRCDRDRVEIGRGLADRIHAVGGLLLINDRADIALACGADGAHLGQDDLPLEVGRALLGPDLLLGASTSYLEEIEPAIAAGVDYLGFGAMFPTDTKADAEYAGLDMLQRVCERASVPIVAIGGISIERARSVLQRGPEGIAVVSALFRASDPAAAGEELLRVAMGSK